MKRIIEFKTTDDEFIFLENNSPILSIDKNSCQLNVQSLYNSFFANGKDYSDIQFICPEGISGLVKHVYDTVTQLVNRICTQLKVKIPDQVDTKVLDSFKTDAK